MVSIPTSCSLSSILRGSGKFTSKTPLPWWSPPSLISYRFKGCFAFWIIWYRKEYDTLSTDLGFLPTFSAPPPNIGKGLLLINWNWSPLLQIHLLLGLPTLQTRADPATNILIDWSGWYRGLSSWPNSIWLERVTQSSTAGALWVRLLLQAYPTFLDLRASRSQKISKMDPESCGAWMLNLTRNSQARISTLDCICLTAKML